MKKWKWRFLRRQNGDVEFVGPGGVGHYASWNKDPRHGCDGECSHISFPGRKPFAGDLALCGKGCLGVISNTEQELVHYLDGTKAMAWVGYHLDQNNPLGAPYLSMWSSRNPIIIGRIRVDCVVGLPFDSPEVYNVLNRICQGQGQP